jgi:ABC-type nitrate/sulfonate/bicarbonate transport system permease component
VGHDATGAVVSRAARGPVTRTASRLAAILDKAPQTAALVLAGVVWEVSARIAGLAFLPPLSEVVVRLVELTVQGEIIGSVASSLLNLLFGFSASVVVGIVVGLLMGVSAKVDAALDIYVNALLTAPSLVFAPIFFSLFGLSRLSIVAVIIMYALFIVIVTTRDSIGSVPQSLVEMARCYGADNRRLYLRIVLPAALPLIMAGVRVSAGRAVKGMVNGEMFIAVVGLGALIMDAGRTFDAATVLAVLLVILAVSVTLVRLLQITDRRLNGWLPATARA